MPQIIIEDFRSGLDARRSIISGAPGSLNEIFNAHITRGGDAEKRKAFLPAYNLPVGTLGAITAAGSIYVFGSAAEPVGIPAGVLYQRLQHPDAYDMTRVVMARVSDGKTVVLAKYSNGSTLLFYDGALVREWLTGIARSTFTTNSDMAADFAAVINADGKFTAVAAGSDVTITGTDNNPFTVDLTTVNKTGGVNDQTLTQAQVQGAVPGTAEILTSATFRITGGSASPGVNKATAVKVNGTAITSGAVDWITSNDVTAQNIAANINAAVTVPNFTASAAGDTVTVSAPVGSGATYNSSSLEVDTAGNVTTCSGGVIVTGGTSIPGTNKITSIKVNGITITNAAVDWTTDNSTTAGLIAANINGFTSAPDYNAFANGPQVIISAVISTSIIPNNLTIAAVVGGDVTLAAVSVLKSISVLGGGQAVAAGQPQITKITFGGTFEIGDQFRVKLGDHVYGADRVSGKTPAAILPLKDKIYVASGSILFFSGVQMPTKYNSDAIGSGLINMSSNTGGAAEISGLGIYRKNIAVFAREVTQIWAVDPDPTLNNQLQVLDNIGTQYGRSIVSFGDSDVFFLSDTGIRSLRARDNTENVNVYDVGTPVDDYVKAVVDGNDDPDNGPIIVGLTDAQKLNIVGAMEPTDGRFWEVIGDKIFVFSYFSTSKISAWSVYLPGFEISDMTTKDGKMHVRSGDTIYAYGGADGKQYDSCRVTLTLPYLDGQKPASHKTAKGIDCVAKGDWDVYCGASIDKPDARELLAHVTGPTLNQRTVGYAGYGTHFGLQFINEAPGPAKLAKAIIHFDQAEED